MKIAQASLSSRKRYAAAHANLLLKKSGRSLIMPSISVSSEWSCLPDDYGRLGWLGTIPPSPAGAVNNLNWREVI